jgi:hypothetical protein
MSDTNYVTVALAKEVPPDWGETPAVDLEYQRMNGEDLGQAQSTTESGEITQTRDVADIVRTEVNADGGINGEVSYGTLDTLAEGMFMSEWTSDITTSATIAAVATGNKFTRASGDFTADGWVVGMDGFAADGTLPATNGYFWVVSVSATELAVGGLTLPDEAAEARTLSNDGMIRNGTTFTSFSIEKQFTDLTNIFHAFRGMVVNTFAVDVQVGSITTWNVAFLGKKAEALGATIGTGYVDANTNSVMNAIDNVTAIYQDDVLSTLDIQQVGLSGNNNVRARRAIGSAEAIGISIGRFMVEGTFKAYFANNTLFNQFLNYTTTKLSFRLYDTDGNAYVFRLPALKITQAKVVATGPDGDVMVEASFRAFRDPATLATMQWTRFDGA